MSRVGNQPIALPSGTNVEVAEREVTIKGPKGSLTQTIPGDIQITADNGIMTVTRPTTGS